MERTRRRQVTMSFLLLLLVVIWMTNQLETSAALVYNQIGAKLVGDNVLRSEFGSQQGYSCALSGDGKTAVVGGVFDDNDRGTVWVFAPESDNGVWVQVGPKVVPNPASGMRLGRSVDLSGDGRTMVIGSDSETWILVKDANDNWIQPGTTPSIQNNAITQAVAISEDGNTIVLGGGWR